MFDQIVSEKTARKPFAFALSVSGQAAMLGLAILVPLLHTQAITTGRLAQFVPIRPWGTQHVTPQRTTSQHVTSASTIHIVTDHVFRAPSVIPSHIAMDADAPAVESIPGESVFQGTPDGVFGVLQPQTTLLPKPAPVQPPAPKPTSAVTPRLKIGGMVQAARILRQVKPIYPAIAKQARVSGTVRLEAVISRDGTVQSLQVTSGHPLLVPAALDAVRQWLYQPTLLNGDPVEVLTQIEVNFRLGE